MILGLEIGMLIYGIIALAKGTFSIGKDREIVGTPARWLGVLCMSPLPLVFTLFFFWGFLGAAGALPAPPDPLTIGIIEAVIAVSIAGILYASAQAAYQRQQEGLLNSQQPFAEPTANPTGIRHQSTDTSNPFPPLR